MDIRNIHKEFSKARWVTLVVVALLGTHANAQDHAVVITTPIFQMSANPMGENMAPQIQFYNNQLRINGMEVPQCFWYDQGHFNITQNSPREVMINNKLIPDYYLNPDHPGAPPPCESVMPGHGGVAIVTEATSGILSRINQTVIKAGAAGASVVAGGAALAAGAGSIIRSGLNGTSVQSADGATEVKALPNGTVVQTTKGAVHSSAFGLKHNSELITLAIVVSSFLSTRLL